MDTNWWTNPSRFKNHLQDPWQDPMSYMDEPSGFLGNGDGRFYYPPNWDPNKKTANRYVAGPVESVRWEMLGEGGEGWEYLNRLAGTVHKAESKG